MDGSGSAFGAEKSRKIKRGQSANCTIFNVDPANFKAAVRALTGVPKNPDPLCPATPSKKQGVFLSSANPRIHFGFAGHLISAFRQKGIRVFTGKDLHRERGFPYPKIIGGIEAFRVSVVIFSDTFARRPPFFDELVNILGCYREKQLEVLPVFYNVNRSDVVHQRGTTGEAFGRLEHTLGAYHVKTWRSALSSIASVPGFLSSEQYPVDSVLVDEIVKDVLRKLSVSDDSNNLLGLQFHLTQVLSLLRIESPDVRIIGIWGAGGIGKTAITEAALKKISGEYDSCYFLRDFDKALQTKGLCHLQDEFFAKLLGEEKILISTFFIKKDFAKERLRHKRILVVLDDARNFRDLECLVGKLDWFGPGSRIILTSRNKQVLIRCQVDEIYVDGKDDACLLFCQNAFRKDHPEKWFLKQAMDILNYVDGNPLALKVLGSNLYGKNLFAWENPSLMIRQNPTYNIFPVLKSSYHSLDDNEKNIFLDLTCFFRGEHEDDVTRFLDGCGFSAHVGLSILGDNSLIYILDNRVEMHNLYQDLGKEIVHGESIEPSKQSRLWDHEEIRHILTYAEGTETIEGISFDMARATFDLSPIAFKNMYRLRLLKIHGFSLKSTYGLNLPQGLEFLPDNLRLLHWENYPLKSLPRRFEPNNLVELNLSYSHIEKLWKGTKNLERLLKIKLSHSHQLIQMPRLSKASNLEHVDLEGCENLVKVGFSIWHLDKLVFFNLKDCSKLQNLPTMVHLVSRSP